LRRLEELGWIRTEQRQTGGRPSVRIEVNPAVFEVQKAQKPVLSPTAVPDEDIDFGAAA
jgi:hypothetical protein